MSCIVTYLTEPASPVTNHTEMHLGMLLMMDMIRRGVWLHSHRWAAREAMDYALFSPEIFPAGACKQFETDCGTDEESGMAEYCICASQITIDREGGAQC